MVEKMKSRSRFSKLKLCILSVLSLLAILSCNFASSSAPVDNTQNPQVMATSTIIIPSQTSEPASPIPNPSETPTTPATSTPTLTPIVTVDSLKATVTADLLSCRYGPGSEYLFLYGLRKGANIKLIGRTEGNNWVYVDGKNKCWVNFEYIDIAGDRNSLPIVYPGIAKLPISPTYPPTAVTKVVRNKNVVTIYWLDIPLKAGDEEDASMQHYIIELWRCEGGKFFFDPLATNDQSLSFTDEPGCSEPSHGRIFVQEKHGLAGPAEIPWPPYPKP
jgi:hypothetical protein